MVQLIDHQLECRYLGDLLHATTSELGAHLATAFHLQPSDLASPTHAHLFAAIVELARHGKEVSPITVRTELEHRCDQVSIDALDDLVQWYNPQPDSLTSMANRIEALAHARRMREHLLRGANYAARMQWDAAEEHAREALCETTRPYLELHSLHASALAAVRHADRAQDSTRYPLGFPVIDLALKGGLRPSTLTVLGGRTSCGKSAFALSAAILQARMGIRVGIVSCEDAIEIWGERAIGHFTELAPERLLGSPLDSMERQALDVALKHLSAIGVQLAYSLNRDLGEVLCSVRALIADGCKVIYLDYIQAILFASGDRREAVRDAAQRLKAECQRHGVCLVLASQLRRPSEHARFCEPTENDLKETGDLENMAEAVFLLWRSSDAESAQELGKITKIKWSPKRPRFALERDCTGAMVNLIRTDGSSHYEYDNATTAYATNSNGNSYYSNNGNGYGGKRWTD